MKPLCACLLLASLGCATLRGPGDRPLRIDWVFTERPSAEGETRAAQRELASRGLEIAKSREEADLVADVEDTVDGLFLRVWSPSEMLLSRGHRHVESCDLAAKDGEIIADLLLNSASVRNYVRSLRDGGAPPAWGLELAAVIDPFVADGVQLSADEVQRIAAAMREAVRASPRFRVLGASEQDALLARGGMTSATCAQRWHPRITYEVEKACRKEVAALTAASLVITARIGQTAAGLWATAAAVLPNTSRIPDEVHVLVNTVEELPAAARTGAAGALRMGAGRY